ncbi:MAG TPA: outer membrane beta-barrel protein, partial [Bacteroidia bacterium]|nr:outer membrane beta-barrel protein [Bacteroidia bacterium]
AVTTGSINKQINYTTNKLKECFINLPVLLDFNTSANPKKSFHLAGGIILGYNIHSKTKQSYQMRNSEINLKVVDDYNLSPFSASATVRAGYGYFSLYATYALNTLFDSNKGPQLTPFTVGISLF